MAEEEQRKLQEAQGLAAAAKRKSEEEAERLAREEGEHLAQEQTKRVAEADEAERSAQEQAQQEAALKAEEEERLAAEQQRLKEEEAQRQVESAANEHQRKVDTLIAGFNADLDAFRLTSPAGNNALSKLQTLLVLEPANPFVNEGFEAIVGRYIGLSRKSSSAGQFDKAETYLDKAATVFADSAALEALAKAEERKAQEAAKAEEAAKAKLALATIPESAIEVTKTGPCSPRLLEPRPSAFPGVVSSVYSHPAFLNAPAPKIKWAKYRSSSLINKKATEESTSRYLNRAGILGGSLV